ncbi:DUF2490 domain-containing protein [Flavobacterium agrisoli]|uniref:DUF2490 domain-containing protein n=1 Tax=Flavobacterium agrisoli TaxID=2793066 RepID=A0A934UL43_9FLAO|nr:DUF2490 domain-containing protein [Flavobacterium agrisoli]MBK0371115.1 hypothetical protein [Flavobacterium agrisoli]
MAQISPSGLGKAHTAEWFAVGLRQDLGASKEKNWQSMSYIGLGRKSNPNNYDPLFKSAIVVFNQEFYHRLKHHWKYAVAISYRRQNTYLDTAPYTEDALELKQEFRLYGRLSYGFAIGNLEIEPTFRQEFRRFYATDFKNISELLQLRSRFRLQVKANLDNEKRHRLLFSSEQLFAVSQKNDTRKWTDFNYHESRFSLYYSYKLNTLPVVLDLGYVHNLVGRSKAYGVHYLALDLVIQNPFHS